MKKLLVVIIVSSFMFGTITEKVQKESIVTADPNQDKTILIDVAASIKLQPRSGDIYVSLSNKAPTANGVLVTMGSLLDSQAIFAKGSYFKIRALTTTTDVYYLKTVQ